MHAETGSARQWTTERVGEAVIEAFRVLPAIPVYSPRPSEFVSVLPGQDTSPLDVIALSEHVLGRSSPERRALLIWARSLATGGDVGGSVRQYCIERDMHRGTFDRQRKRACTRIAAELNRIGGEALAQLEALHRSAPPLADQIDRM
ncbi:hypothetical protein MKK88_02485 [Methylobacterium sp. E-005]|uniref:hypothetical protein n=1 Tax=Methylobacterium sp. E-005 TaxID=2836549 RepID=UPI001FB88ADF|nr:hypothetical protein [Methylobacterium sp. E-005]MCJ2084861.1 hypothetical protein [Methylobacterium sp. E-005]